MSAKRVEYHQGAIADVKSAVAWYQKRSPAAALDFIKELDRAVDTIREGPERWPIGKNSTRRFLLWRFPFAIIYSEQESVIMIWAVAHGSRRPEYWARRL
ncbi:MAG: type II toxin-antitoxin system RelE/ParE family toxin [Acidobacteriia bacterium]|nr:type II toxin-antitoxin system RelE/ParE family toxin [Terriglobia bacterium]